MAFMRKLQHPDAEEEYRSVLAHHRGLTSKVNHAISLAANISDPLLRDQLANDLLSVEESTNAISRYLSFEIPPKYYNQHRQDNSQAATNVFAIPELLENILQHADVKEILTIRQVRKQLDKIVDASLQLRLGYKAAGATKFAKDEYVSSFDSGWTGWDNLWCPGFNVHANPPGSERWGPPVHAAFDHVRTRSDLPKIGAAWRRMLICQPPIQLMQVALVCAKHGSYEMEDVRAAGMGLTLGDLRDRAVEMLGDNCVCVACKAGQPPTQGWGDAPYRHLSMTFQHHIS